MSPKSRKMHQDYGDNVSYITYPWSNERRKLRTLSEHLYSPVRLPLSRIDVFNTLMAPLVNPSWSTVVHIKTMHAFTAPESVAPLTRAYRLLSYPRTVKVAEAIIINSESLRTEIEQHLDVDPSKLRLIPEAVDHDLFKPGDADEARAHVAAYGVTKPFVLFVSSLWPYKNCDGLLRAWAHARAALGDRQLVIVGAGRDEEYAASLPALARELGIADDVVFVGGIPLAETVPFYRAADVFVYPSFNETFGLPILEAMACGCPVVTSNVTAMPETAGGAAVLCDPTDPASIAKAILEATGPARDRLHRAGTAAGRPVHMGRDRRGDARRLPRSRRTQEEATEMKILVTGGAGFIGSHTSDRLLALGHEVVVLDALTAPVHRGGVPMYLSPGVDFYQGDVRNRDLLANLLRRVDAVYHFAAYQDYLPDFARFSDVNVVSTALIYEIIVAERLDIARVVVASSQSAMGEGLYLCPHDGEQLPGMRPEKDARGRPVGHPVPAVRRAAGDAAHPRADLQPAERLRHVQARRGDGRHQPRPPVRDPDGRAALQHRAGPAAVGVQRVLGRVPHLLPELPAGVSARPLRGRRRHPGLRQHQRRGGRQRARARRRARRRAGLQRRRRQGQSPPGSSPTSSCASTARPSRAGHRRVPLRRHAAHLLRHQRAAVARLGTAARTTADSVAAYAEWLKGMDGLDGVLAAANAQMRSLGVVRKAAV